MITISFKDPQGTVFTDAIVMIRNCNMNVNTSENLNINLNDRENVTYDQNLSGNSYANYSVIYWSSLEVFQSGYAPYILYSYDSPNSGDSNFSFEVTSEYDGMDTVAACEHHVTKYVLATVLTTQ